MRFCIYSKDTGAIKRFVDCADESCVILNLESGCGYLPFSESGGLSNYKVNLDTNAVISKTIQSLSASISTIDADGVDLAIISGIAVNSIAEISTGEGSTFATCQTGKLNFTANIADTHNIIFRHPLWLDTEVEIIATVP